MCLHLSANDPVFSAGRSPGQLAPEDIRRPHHIFHPLDLILITLLFLSCHSSSQSFFKGTAVSADGVPIRYETYGSGSPAVVFVHCWCCDRGFWDEQVSYFSQKYRVVTLDLAGHGESGLERQRWTIPAFGQDVVAVVNTLGLEQVALVGHSMGGPVIVEAARRIPGRVIGLVGVDNFQDLGTIYSDEQVEQWLRSFRDDFVSTTENFVRTMFPPTADAELVERIVASMSQGPSEVGVGSMEGMLFWFKNDLPTAAGEVKAPIHCINSDLFPTDEKAARRFFPSYQVSYIKGVGHFVQMENPGDFNRLLDQVLQGFRQNGANP